MALEASELRTLLTEVDAEIAALLVGDGSGLINYAAGDRKVDKTTRLRELRRLRRELVRQLASIGAEESSLFDDPAL